MPTDAYDARALALPIDDSPSPSPRRSSSPAWVRRSNTPTNAATTLKTRLRQSAEKLQRQAERTYNRLTPLQRTLLALALVGTVITGILFLVYNERIFGWLAPFAKRWRDVRAGWLILWALTFVVSFPPLIGYSSCVTIAGFVYGFPHGWFIVSTATILGSTCSFLLSRTLLRPLVQRLVAHDPRFAALSLTLKHDGLKLLVMIRLCPLPYSLSNGAIATFPTVHWAAFALATALASPKLLLHVFVGAKLGQIADHGGSMDARTRAISYLSIVIGVAAGAVTGWVMWRKTRARARQLEEEERERLRGEGEREYADELGAEEVAELAREDEDDISLRPAYADEGAWYQDEDGGDDEPPDVFGTGDGDEEEGGVRRS